ncbi:unnamed protein product [Acanthoscelides obtectus]|uniref:Uncharacterized protein n=1 Tax=Acanthoscelides obtectus TaxID=200917 RepID=A0A9P0PA50_ACAOB|nr:unnamed protein product [Acanthoscelides obtectus]CAK1655781.1 hypothetical protein AOBTE_LOCUS19330 [Acanthoscelides obtectus]
MLNSSTQSHINWTVNNLHGIPRDLSPSEESCLHYEQLTLFIKENVHDEPIFVKARSNQQWLERFITNNITDLHEIGCPNLRKLKKIFQYKHCYKHLYNNMHCALENVHLLFNWNLISNASNQKLE